MSFRHRLALFLVVTLVAVQAFTAVLAYGILRTSLIERAKSELGSAARAFTRQLGLVSTSAEEDVKVLSLDYALRQAIAQRDYATEVSALRNHGRRVGAARMMLIGLDGAISADTAVAGAGGAAFPYPDLLNDAANLGERAALVSPDGRVYWIVIVPVRAPVPIAFIAAFIPVDDALLARLREISTVQSAVALAARSPRGRWSIASHAGALPGAPLIPQIRSASGRNVALVDAQGRDYLIVSARLASAERVTPIAAVFSYPLDDAMTPYWRLLWPVLAVLAVALAAALAGAMLIVRGVSRPLETLAAAARRIASGDYTPPPRLEQRDELGQLSDALRAMTRSIAEREGDLTSAIAAAEDARRAAVHADRAKSHFLANMSHELRTPLNAIMGFAEMLHQEVLGPIGVVRYREYALDISGSANKLLGQVSRMLDLAEIEGGRLELGHEAFAPFALLQQSISVSRIQAKNAGVTMSVLMDPQDEPRMTGDGGKFRQAFLGLIHNAIKFTPRGGYVVVSAKVLNDTLAVRIEDTGIGIAKDDLAAVTRPFQRLRSALDGLHQGAGLGLAFAKAIIELHGGSLRIESEPGRGTRILVAMPLNGHERAAAA